MPQSGDLTGDATRAYYARPTVTVIGTVGGSTGHDSGNYGSRYQSSGSNDSHDK